MLVPLAYDDESAVVQDVTVQLLGGAGLLAPRRSAALQKLKAYATVIRRRLWC